MTLRAVAAVALVGWAGTAAAYLRSRAPCGVCFYWEGNPPAVTYEVNVDSFGASACGAGTLAAVQASFARWSGVRQVGAADACSGLALQYGGATSELRVGYDAGGTNENLVVFRSGWCSAAAIPATDPCWRDLSCGDVYGCFDESRPSSNGASLGRGVIALTTVTYQASTGRILDADTELAGWDGEPGGLAGSPPPFPSHGWYLTCVDPPASLCTTYGQAGCRYMDLEAVATHEAGHFVGFAHDTDDSSIMFQTIAVATSASKRTLTAADVDGVCTVYPLGQAALTCPATADCGSGGTSGCGCGHAGAAGPLALAALIAIMPRRRRRGIKLAR